MSTFHESSGNGCAHSACRPARPRRAALLLNLGTPDEPTTPVVRRYLVEFLSDPEVVTLPPRWKWATTPLAWLIALFRAPQSAHAYSRIWTQRGSPLRVITEDQVAALERALPGGWRVFYAMRYGNPSVAAALEEIEAAGIEELVVVPMYPQFAGPTTRTAMTEFSRELSRRNLSANIRACNAWYDDAGYVEAQAQLLHEFIQSGGRGSGVGGRGSGPGTSVPGFHPSPPHPLTPANSFLLFSTHSMPTSYIRRGDPYQRHILRTVELVAQRLGWPAERMCVSYQSKLGPNQWLEPSTAETIARLRDEGERNLIICPISFTADCLETLEELGMVGAEEFEKGGGRLHLCPALNTYDPFIRALARIVLRGPKPIDATSTPIVALNGHAPPRDPVESLVMIGVCESGPLGRGRGPLLHCHDDSETFNRLRTPQAEVPALLRRLREDSDFEEIFLWNTCHRIEVYGWFGDDSSRKERSRRIATTLFGDGEDSCVNMLHGRDAWHHLLRTAAGLNSRLPGELDILDQLRTSHRLAMHAGTVGPLTQTLIQRADETVARLREETTWGEHSIRYASVALRQFADAISLPFDETRWLVVGGSTTSRGLLHALREEFAVPDGQLTLAYRGAASGCRVTLLRKAVGHGQRLRVNEYTDGPIREAIAQVDVVGLGLDRRQAVIRAADLRGMRDFAARPLTIIDFNTLGSVEDDVARMEGVRLVTAEAVDRAIARFTDDLLETEAFGDAAEEADRWLAAHRAGIPTPLKGFGAPDPGLPGGNERAPASTFSRRGAEAQRDAAEDMELVAAREGGQT